jgi:RsiW-degrading membrane proteinase PrsW (M82 family)
MEEFLKILLIIILIRKQILHNPITALFTGLSIGLGFSIVGNIFMLKSMQNIGTVSLIFRGISTAFNQGLLTGIASSLIILLLQKNRFKLSGSSIIAVLLVSILHSISNYLFSNLFLSLAINLLFLPISIIFMFKPRI